MLLCKAETGMATANFQHGSQPSVEVMTGRQQVRRAGAAARATAHDSASARPRPGQRVRPGPDKARSQHRFGVAT